MPERMTIRLEVNGRAVSCEVEPRTHLIDFLRDSLQIKGARVGCEHGVCGACTVRLDGRMVRGCLLLAVQAQNARVETIEGASDRGDLAELQAAFHARNASGHADRRGRTDRTETARQSRRDPQIHVRQLLPLYGVSGNRRRHRGRSRSTPAAHRGTGAIMLRKRQQNDIGLDERRYIGSAVARPNARRLLQGRGTYVDDIALPI
jgi:hypothetical protein